MQDVDTLFRGVKLVDGTHAAIAVKDGKIIAIGPDADSGTTARSVVDLGGGLVVPGFVEGHIHLDTSFYGDTWKPHKPCTAGFDVRERVEFQRQNMAAAAPMDERARNQLDLCITNGATQMRSHVMVDASVGLKSLETILAVREEYRDRIDIQLVAFPQSGIITCPGTAELLDAAFDIGCDLIGGLDPASFDRDASAHLDVVFGIAEKRGVGIDIHLHEPNMLGIFDLEEIAARTRALGLQGKVAVSHAYALGEVPIEVVRRTAQRLAEAGVAIMTNAPGSSPFPPVKELRTAGVTVFSGSDNIRDSWWPYGDGDMLGRAMMIGYRSGFYTDEELGVAFDVVTESGAKALGLSDYGLRVGANADFVVLKAEHIPEAVVALPKPRSVYKAGRCVVSNGVLARR
ncbi:amidohydrolase family protein [Singulisphaera sp. Ch08]|uniref:Amidohydrolase family protein n=1 Tax=Singulisphaera sp. Ch08 TaxID=3120278 RepID=A0AAU7CK22_9BACT